MEERPGPRSTEEDGLAAELESFVVAVLQERGAVCLVEIAV